MEQKFHSTNNILKKPGKQQKTEKFEKQQKTEKLEKQQKIEKIEKTGKHQKKEAIGKIEDTKDFRNLPTLPIKLKDFSRTIDALIDSGANGNFISEDLIVELGIPIIKKKTPTDISLADKDKAVKLDYPNGC